jgi:hypothetical protein
MNLTDSTGKPHSLKDLIFSYPSLRHYSTSLEDGKLKISSSGAWFWRAIFIASLTALFTSTIFSYLFIYFPPVEKRWSALVVAGAICVLMNGAMLFIIAAGMYRVHTIDRNAGVVFLRSRKIYRVSEIARVEVMEEHTRGSRRQSYVLVLVSHDGKRHPLIYRIPPSEELIELANILGDFVGAPVSVHG